jgi:cytochrome c oxidase cbb3-type subunit 3
MHRGLVTLAFTGGMALLVIVAIAQEVQVPAGGRASATPEQRAAATRAFLGLGPAPDKEAVARGAPIYQQNCAFCHGPQARGAEGPNLVVSDVVLSDDHGEHLVPFLKKGRPEKGMPAFASVPNDQLKDISEFLHQQIEDVANRGTYHLLNIVVGDAGKGKTYVSAHCMSCHSAATFDHISTKFRTPDQLQRGWIWPNRPADGSLAITATVKAPDGGELSGRVTQINDFRVTLMGSDGKSHVIERGPGVDVVTKDPLAPHEVMIMTLKNDDMHDVTAYLETLK